MNETAHEREERQEHPLETVTAIFADHRELLFSVAYNILGTVADTEDVLQETWLAWAVADHDRIGNARAYLVRIAVNEALSRLRRVKRDRETYIGPWLPEPLVMKSAASDAAEDTLQAESVSLALMVVLETLSPLERAVFVLRDVFGYSYPEIATLLDRSQAAVRQLAHRAREHVQARRPRRQVDPRARKEVTERFLAAATGGDLSTLMEVLAPDVALWTDAGGKVKAARRVVVGRDKVARLLTSDKVYGDFRDLTMRLLAVNGEPAAGFFAGDELYAVGVFDVSDDGEHISGIYGILNPDKLRNIAV